MSELLKPPAVPSAILNFFASQPDFPAVAGDISEEFHQRAQNLGAKAATRWYWREALRNAWALTVRELVRTPVRTTLIALSCFFAVNFVTGLPFQFWRLPGQWYVVLALFQLMTLFLAGLVGGRLLPGREWALALTFTAFSICFAWALRWYFPPLRMHFTALQWAIVIVGSASRQGAFWLGSLWIRVHSRSFVAKSTDASIPRSSAPRNPPDLS